MKQLTLLFLLPISAFGVTIPQLPPSEYADTEVSTYIPFVVSLETMNQIKFTLTCDASPTNAVEVSVGAYENGDGRFSILGIALETR